MKGGTPVSDVRVDRLIEARDWALANPDEFDMGAWGSIRANACGTTACIAGHGFSRAHPRLWKEGLKLALRNADEYSDEGYVSEHLGKRGLSVYEEARKWFGLSRVSADYLFYAPNQLWLGRINKLIEENS